MEDKDNPLWTAADLVRAVGPEVLSDVELGAFPETPRPRGRPTIDQMKTEVKLRLDPDVVHAFKADGPGWQIRMNDALRRAAKL